MQNTPLSPETLKAGYPHLVHVEGWRYACAFRYVSTDADGLHHLITPKTKREFTTYNNLLPTNKNKTLQS
jgi:hypothetical protein